MHFHFRSSQGTGGRKTGGAIAVKNSYQRHRGLFQVKKGTHSEGDRSYHRPKKNICRTEDLGETLGEDLQGCLGKALDFREQEKKIGVGEKIL